MYCFRMFALISLFQVFLSCVRVCVFHAFNAGSICSVKRASERAHTIIEAKVAVFYGVHVECTRSNGNTYSMVNVFNISLSTSSSCVCTALLPSILSYISQLCMFMNKKNEGGANT